MKLGMSASRWRILVWIALAALVFAALTYIAGDSADGSTELERRLAGTLSQIDGAGDVRVMILDSSDAEQTQSVYASASSAQSGTIRGVIIVAEGADDLGTRIALSRAVQAIFDVDASSIEVFPMQGG